MSKEHFKPQVANINSYLLRFESADLAGGNVIVIQHNLRAEYPVVMVYNGSNVVIVPDSVTYLDEDRVQLDLTSSTPLTGVWHVRVIKE